jgi:hypothetical protein
MQMQEDGQICTTVCHGGRDESTMQELPTSVNRFISIITIHADQNLQNILKKEKKDRMCGWWLHKINIVHAQKTIRRKIQFRIIRKRN